MKNKSNQQQPDNGRAGKCNGISGMERRDFLKLTGTGSLALLMTRQTVMAGPFNPADFEKLVPSDKKLSPAWVKSLFERGAPQVYHGADLQYIGMPVGGLCAGQLYLGGDGKLWHWDIFNRQIATADGHYAKPPSPSFPLAQGFALSVTMNGKTETRSLDKSGCPEVTFRGEYPIGMVNYGTVPGLPVAVSLEAFSPFVPLAVDDSSMPATFMRFTVRNDSSENIEATLFGWLENAVCRQDGLAAGRRRNKMVRGEGFTFLDCAVEKVATQKADPKPDVCFEEWNRETYGDWTAEGTAFGTGPIKKSAVPAYQGDVGGDTERVVNSHATAPGQDTAGKDGATGKLTSRKFTVERNFINLWIGGGAHKDKTCLNVLVDDKVVRTATGMGDNRMTPKSLDVREWLGKQALIQVVDSESGGWGNIGVGRITFSDVPVAAQELEKMEDFGTMGLALLGKAADWAAAANGENGTVAGAADEDSTPLDQKLVGGLGRKLNLRAGESAVVTFVLTWNFPNLKNPGQGRYYATKFASAQAVAEHMATHHERLYAQTKLWRDTWYDSTLPYWFLDRTFANASILATSTAFRFANGNFWGWEGVGCCAGTCTHVWHYEQTMGRIFPELDILLREKTDFNPAAALHADGSIGYRGGEGFAIDGQAGIILRCLRDHQVSPDDAFLRRNWAEYQEGARVDDRAGRDR